MRLQGNRPQKLITLFYNPRPIKRKKGGRNRLFV